MNDALRQSATELFASTGDLDQVLDMLSEYSARSDRAVVSMLESIQGQIESAREQVVRG